MGKISIIHPSRGRPDMAIETMVNWMRKAVNPSQIEYIFSFDSDDETLLDYTYNLGKTNYPFLHTVNDNTCLVEAANKGASKATGDLLILLSDDFDCPNRWDELLYGVIGTDASKPKAILINDGICEAGDILSLPIINRTLYDKLGYIYHPSFFSLFADNALLEVSERLGALINARHIIFQHKHYTVGLSQEDETYRHENSSTAYNIGKSAIEKLRLNNYGL